LAIQRKKLLKSVLKLLVSAAALYLVSRKIDVKATWQLIKQLNLWYLTFAVLLFNASQWLSAKRLQLFLKGDQVVFDYHDHLKLYYIGMFYNLFLPGGIGGDGYKIYWINRRFSTKVKNLIATLLLDRISGLVAILGLASSMVIFVFNTLWVTIAALILIIVAVLLYRIVVFNWFSRHRVFWTSTTLSAFGVQFIQLICGVNILLALGVTNNFLAYLLLFLVSSIAAVIPVTIGGVGAREVVYIYGHQYFGVDEKVGVAFTLLFIAITAVSSLFGGFLSMSEKGVQPSYKNENKNL
jgi:uncharacterized membrane protein YbhN (UPF0104 family)